MTAVTVENTFRNWFFAFMRASAVGAFMGFAAILLCAIFDAPHAQAVHWADIISGVGFGLTFGSFIGSLR